jgi:hypothetical protein
MPTKTYLVTPTDAERQRLTGLVSAGKRPALAITRARWTLKLLADKLVELEVVEAISDETVRRALKKTCSSRT